MKDSEQACCQSRYPATALPTATTVQLGAEYRRLKEQKCPACTYALRQRLSPVRVLGERLDGQPRSTLQQLLRRPNQVRSDSLVYHWHGEHDYLYFRLGADQREYSALYYAYE